MRLICIFKLYSNCERSERNGGLDLACSESEEEEFFECSSEELASEEISSARTQLKAKHLLWNKPAGRLAKHPSLRFVFLCQRTSDMPRESARTRVKVARSRSRESLDIGNDGRLSRYIIAKPTLESIRSLAKVSHGYR